MQINNYRVKINIEFDKINNNFIEFNIYSY